MLRTDMTAMTLSRFRRRFGAGISVLLLLTACSGRQAVEAPNLPLPAETETGVPSTELDLSMAAMRTERRYREAVDSGELTPYGPIPPEMWEPAIKGLNPIRIYMHRMNLVIVQQEIGGREEGIYLTNPISSYAPFGNDDGFETSREADGLIHDRRRFGSGPVSTVEAGGLHGLTIEEKRKALS
jgi:hypothetical protein